MHQSRIYYFSYLVFSLTFIYYIKFTYGTQPGGKTVLGGKEVDRDSGSEQRQIGSGDLEDWLDSVLTSCNEKVFLKNLTI